jgi:NTE family protein
MSNFRSRLLAGVLLINGAYIAGNPALAQPVASAGIADRPRIGLVLGGGGAKGAAHIGVLRVLDELRIPVDCIAGTSMGALVGGTLATGMSPA